jgi:hypothetical protein
MISQILKFALEVIVVAFIAHYVAQKMEKAIDTKDACVIGIGAACVITVIERCFNKREFFDEDYDEEYDSDSEDESDDYENVDNTNDKDPALKETKVIEGFADEAQKEVVVKVDAKGVVQEAKNTKPVATNQVRGRLSMQEQKIVDAVQTEAVKKEIKQYNKGGPRSNPNYGYSFLPPAEWNLPLPDMKKCIPQKVCPPCPLLGIDNGAYLNVTGAKQLPPKPVKKE